MKLALTSESPGAGERLDRLFRLLGSRIERQDFFAVFLLDAHLDGVLARERAVQQLFGERILEQVLDRPAKRSGAEFQARAAYR